MTLRTKKDPAGKHACPPLQQNLWTKIILMVLSRDRHLGQRWCVANHLGNENSNYTVRYFGHHWHGGLTFTVPLILVRRLLEEADVTLLFQLRWQSSTNLVTNFTRTAVPTALERRHCLTSDWVLRTKIDSQLLWSNCCLPGSDDIHFCW